MPVSIETQADLDARRACVRQLYGLGMSFAQIDEALDVPPGTTCHARARRLRHSAHERRSASDRFAQMFERFAVFSTISDIPHDQRMVVADSHPGPYALAQLAIILEVALKLPNVWARLREEEALYKRMMSAGTHEPQWCYKLLETVFGTRTLVRDLNEVIRVYLADVARGRASVPESTDAVYEALSARIVETARESMRPDWPAPERVEQIVRCALSQLDDREVDVLERRCRDDEAIDSIARGHGLTRERIRQIEAKAWRKLRHPSRRETLDPLWSLVSLSWDATVGAQERLAAYRDGLTGLLESQAGLVAVAPEHLETLAGHKATPSVVDALCRTVDELELSVRALICLENGNIKHVWELVIKTEDDLLRIKNLGLKALNEIKEILAEIPAGTTHLTLGMSADDPNIVAAMERCPRD